MVQRTDGSSSDARSRVLCLHGLGGNSTHMKWMCSTTLLKPSSALAEMLDVTFMDAPMPCKMFPSIAENFPSTMPCFEWKDFCGDYTRGIHHIMRYCQKNGPFDGIIGFSEGTVALRLLLAMQQRGELATNFKYAICIGSLVLEDWMKGLGVNADDLMSIGGEKIPIPMAYIYCADDEVAEQFPASTKETQYFSNVRVVRHESGGHVVPKLADNDIKLLRTMIVAS